ncbi:NAD-dependent epimerase/dehydratase family protein [Micavibrio aeruginosavorus]|uniref:UDP-glucose 4-epimerase n=1 Tax=Micavibrio aeruginosavorus EPB TaxID=349215 RepID=M4VIC5_9BACT|nr:NAD(P)-dependent oxidoreductase [Micavibrio aeruginosavorus]AGH97796.1 UDP-glucose 4-epimerase [Micavibrio aeruginosavorus EPB]
MSAKSRIVVTGANGLIGRELLLSFCSEHEIHAVVRKIPDQPVNDVIYHKVDFSDEWDVSDLPSSPDVIYHLAQSENFRDFPNSAMDVFRVNIDSTARLLDYARKSEAARFVYASSGGIYGTGVHAFHENSPISEQGKLGYYLGSKLCGEILAESYASHMHVNIMRFFFVYGAEQKRGMLLPRLVDNVKSDRSIALQGENGISINPIHVSDAVRALRKVMDLDQSATFNVAGPDTYSLREIANMIGEFVGKEPIFQNADNSGGDIVANIDFMRSVLCEPKVSLRDGVKELIQ